MSPLTRPVLIILPKRQKDNPRSGRNDESMTNKEQAKMLRSAASALEHGRYATARRKIGASLQRFAVTDTKS